MLCLNNQRKLIKLKLSSVPKAIKLKLISSLDTPISLHVWYLVVLSANFEELCSAVL